MVFNLQINVFNICSKQKALYKLVGLQEMYGSVRMLS